MSTLLPPGTPPPSPPPPQPTGPTHPGPTGPGRLYHRGEPLPKPPTGEPPPPPTPKGWAAIADALLVDMSDPFGQVNNRWGYGRTA